ncbi:uncharacterized protein Triagg1_499 [Trichoderma aggressivum f. europaeum]|uniref:Uncharacterized protein n=1 Tax=Trichoderma aggressivum f. europaeum TaxID=173218 RepID=A0AAE1M599_9HYPO|nr:hypothetical protein Triagg1_499 [Trichoderma aggressivum f. europaeum]
MGTKRRETRHDSGKKKKENGSWEIRRGRGPEPGQVGGPELSGRRNSSCDAPGVEQQGFPGRLGRSERGAPQELRMVARRVRTEVFARRKYSYPSMEELQAGWYEYIGVPIAHTDFTDLEPKSERGIGAGYFARRCPVPWYLRYSRIGYFGASWEHVPAAVTFYRDATPLNPARPLTTEL